jgi:broad specificity phosphatase PhoE
MIGEEIGFTGEYIVDDALIEQDMGEYAGKTLSEVANMVNANVEDHHTLRRFYKENSVENMAQFEERILRGYSELLGKYKGKKILIVAHA